MEAMPTLQIPHSTWLSWLVHEGHEIRRVILAELPDYPFEMAAKNVATAAWIGHQVRADMQKMFKSVVSIAKARFLMWGVGGGGRLEAKVQERQEGTARMRQ